MTPAPVTTPDGALSRATSSPHAKTAPAVDLLPGSGRQSLQPRSVLLPPRLDIAAPGIVSHDADGLCRFARRLRLRRPGVGMVVLAGHRSSVSSPLAKALKPASDIASPRLAQELLHDPQTEFENRANDQR